MNLKIHSIDKYREGKLSIYRVLHKTYEEQRAVQCVDGERNENIEMRTFGGPASEHRAVQRVDGEINENIERLAVSGLT